MSVPSQSSTAAPAAAEATVPADNGGTGAGPAAVAHSRVASNAVIYLLGQLLSWSVTFVTVSIIPRRLGETGYGQLMVASTAVGTVSSILALSIEQHVMTEVGRDHRRAAHMVGALWGLRTLMALPMVACALIVLTVTHASPMVFALGYLMIAAAVVGYMSGPLKGALIGFEEARRVTVLDIIGAFSALLAVPLLAYGPIAVPAVGLGMAVIVFVVAAAFVRRECRPRPRFEPLAWLALIRGGLPFLMNDSVTQFYGFSSIFLLRRFAGEAAVGEFAQALRLQGTFMFVPVAMGTALLPSLARLADADEGEFRRMQSRVLALMLALSLPVATTVFLLAHPFCRLLYGPDKFQHVPLALQAAALCVVPLYVNIIIYRFLVAQRKNLVWSFFMMGTVGMNAAGCYVLIPVTVRRLGNAPVGAVVASLLAECITVVFAFVLLRNNPLNASTVGRIARSLVATAAMAGVMLATRRLFVVVPAALGLTTFAVIAWRLRVLGADEQARLMALLRQRLARR
ncbi:MAG: oligosaccharide flippase family protein [Chthonomonadales bacterium]|nr:oligosaccharide flippase family protein [Chthonomonadales bacterium]